MLGALLGDAWGIFSYRWTIAVGCITVVPIVN
jgi:hypothetical protein